MHGNKKYNKYDIKGDYGIGYTTKGFEFYFDLEDYDLIKDYCWEAEYNSFYLRARDCKNNKNIRLHNLIMKTAKTIDHINHNSLDNRKENLRVCNAKLNSKNTSKPKNSECPFMGVSIEHNSYVARIGHNRKKINLGSYKTLEEAIIARLKAEKELCGEFAPQRDLFEQYGI